MIELNDVSIEFPDFAVRDICLRVFEGEFFALLGPTGAGKTLILEAIAGVVSVSRGRIAIRGADVTDMPPEKRRVGIVYQDLGLFPNLNVLDNIRYGLRYHVDKDSASSQTGRVQRLVELLGLGRLLKRPVHNLSGGEKQRIALARCLAVNPSLVLLDEPVSSLDVNKRKDVLTLLKDLHENLGATFLMVTHEFSQVMFLAQRAAIIKSGRLEQMGDVSDIFQRPQTRFVAEFVGMSNLWPATFQGNTALVNNVPVRLAQEDTTGRQFLGVRPEKVRVSLDPPRTANSNVMSAIVTAAWNVGPYYEVTAQSNGISIRSHLTESTLPVGGLKRGMQTFIAFSADDVHTF
jgi:molybdate/tungstate transport system ATP-binding protein